MGYNAIIVCHRHRVKTYMMRGEEQYDLQRWMEDHGSCFEGRQVEIYRDADLYPDDYPEAWAEEDSPFAAIRRLPSKYLRFEQVDAPERKTERWQVVSVSQDGNLGWIQWFGRWRQYCFSPSDETIYNAVCLRDIAAFITERMRERYESARSGPKVPGEGEEPRQPEPA